MILHIWVPEKFTLPFIEFTSENFDIQCHRFFFQPSGDELRGVDPNVFSGGGNGTLGIDWFRCEEQNPGLLQTLKLVLELYRSEKIIIHGLFLFKRLAQLLAHCPFLLGKTYWVMWGGDFYFPEHADRHKRTIIRKMGHLLTYIPGDVQYVRQHYGATGEHIECLMYPSNIFTPVSIPLKPATSRRIQVGNSATATNHHEEVFGALTRFENASFEIICPLAYGDRQYRDRIISLGRRLFGDRFVPIKNAVPLDEYRELLASIDIAIFDHNRQQGMGNIITHLGLGHKVYLRSDQSPWGMFEALGIEVHDIADGIDLEYRPSEENQRLIASHFTREKLVQQWRGVFEGSS
jgi:hypothetical protein